MVNVIEKTVPLELNGRTYPLKSTWNVEAEIMEKFGDTPLNFKDGTTKDSMTKVIQFLVILINEAVDIHNDSSEEKWDYVDGKYVGRYVSVHDFTKILDVVADVFLLSRPEASEDSEDPNKTAPQA